MGQNEPATSVQELKELRTMAGELKVGTSKIPRAKVVSNRFDTTAFKAKYGALYGRLVEAWESCGFSIA